ncbi:MAG: ribonuclease III [Phycisphaerales bacterium]|jgi:ribonuclease-3
MDQKNLQQVERILNYHFSDHQLLEKAFYHSSAADNRTLSNERLEFLGDAVLGVVICQSLFDRFPDYLEGDLTKIKSSLVSRRTCSRVIRKLGLQKFLKVGKGMNGSSSLSGSLAAGLFEALVAAIYIDGGFDAAKKFILNSFNSMIDQADAKQAHGNYKSLLQQYAQQHFNITPTYLLLDEKGPDHNKCFEVEAVIADRHFPSAWGTNKKDAEQKAAHNALEELEILEKSPPE